MVEHAEDAQVFIEEQEEMKQATEQEREEQADAVDGKSHHMGGLVCNCRKRDQDCQCGN